MILFCYGTLEIPDVIETITRKTFASAAAIAPNYARYMLKKEEYPGLVAEEGNETPGTAYFDVDDISMKKIAQYEDTCYELRTILITANGTEHQALAFVVPIERSELLSDQSWDRQRFIDTQLESFLRYL